MKFTLEIDCDNDAFQPSPAAELARILREVAEDLDSDAANDADPTMHTIMDANGNTCGYYELTED